MTRISKKSALESLRGLIVEDRRGTFFGVSGEVFNKVWKELTDKRGNSVTYISMEIGADWTVHNPIKRRIEELGITDAESDATLDRFIKLFLHGPGKIPNYSGGLGILAGDTLKSFADCSLPVAAISLLYRKGYFSQLVDSELGQVSWASDWSPEKTPGLYLLHSPDDPQQPLEIEVPFFDNNDTKIQVRARLWMKMEVSDTLDFFVPVILLDYHTPTSPEWVRQAAEQLYDSSTEHIKIVQRRLLGAGVMPAVRALGLTSKTIHLNEQHGVGVVINLILQDLRNRLGENFVKIAGEQDILHAAQNVSEKIVYTIHTPVKAGHDRFAKQTFRQLGHSFCQQVLQLLAKDKDNPEMFNFTSLAMRVNRATNSVSRLHKLVTQKQFPEFASKITAVTNGVHHLTWISDAKAELYDKTKELSGWRKNPSVFAKAGGLLVDSNFRTSFRKAWDHDTNRLISYVNSMLSRHRHQRHETWIDPPNFLSYLGDQESRLDPAVFTVGFARRFSTYKRADLIFENLDALVDITARKNMPINFLYAGKAHPSDEPGKLLIKQVLRVQEELHQKSGGLLKLVFIPDYDMEIAKLMVAGVHAWLNSPKRPLEASGTSGMKAALNGIPNISIMDGWWVEGYHAGETGWKFGHEDPVDAEALSEDRSALLYGEDSASFYTVLPAILKAFYLDTDRAGYLDKCIMNLALNCPIFNTHRMIAEYTSRYELSLDKATQKNIDNLQKLYHSEG